MTDDIWNSFALKCVMVESAALHCFIWFYTVCQHFGAFCCNNSAKPSHLLEDRWLCGNKVFNATIVFLHLPQLTCVDTAEGLSQRKLQIYNKRLDDSQSTETDWEFRKISLVCMMNICLFDGDFHMENPSFSSRDQTPLRWYLYESKGTTWHTVF